jgi:Protein of unknown function (DUF2938)
MTTVMIGIGATALTDAWAILRRRLFGVALPNYGLVGRWFGHMLRGRFVHTSIAAAAPIRGEGLLGWWAHYAIGIAFAAVLLAIVGPDWVRHPTLAPALLVGVVSVAAPLLLMHPGMGTGIAASRTPRPNAARVQSLITHTVFGLGLFLAALATRLMAPS